jgi:hypothetical protein
MSGIAYLRNGIKTGPKPTYFDIQPEIRIGEPPSSKTPMIPRDFKPFRQPLIPSANQVPHTRLVLGLKPAPFSIRTGMDPGPMHQNAHQGYGRHQNKGLSFKLDGKDRTAGKLLVQADSAYAGLNNRLPIPM